MLQGVIKKGDEILTPNNLSPFVDFPGGGDFLDHRKSNEKARVFLINKKVKDKYIIAEHSDGTMAVYFFWEFNRKDDRPLF